jgi:hypothetical protein
MMSTNGGFTYTVLTGLPNKGMLSIAIYPGYATDGTVFMCGAGGLWMSTNSGASWAPSGGMPLSAGVQSVVVAPNFTASGVAFAINDKFAYGSTNHGTTWQQVTSPSPLTSNLTVAAISSNFAVDQTIAVGSVSNGIFLSTNAGQTWTNVTASMTLAQVTAIAFSPAYATDQTIFAVTQGGGVYESTNGGTRWAAFNSGLTDLKVTSLALSPNFATDNTLWVAAAVGGVFKSSNRAGSWTPSGVVPRPLSPQTDIHYVSLATAATPTGTTVFVAMFEGLWLSSNGGDLWSYCDTIPTRLVRAMTLSPCYAQAAGCTTADQTVFVSTYGGGTLWSFDGGGSDGWTFNNTGVIDSYTDAIAMPPNYDSNQMAWVGTTAGLERISNGSTVWTMMDMCDNAETFPRSLGVSPGFASDQTIFIGTHAGPVYPTPVTCGGIQYPSRGLFKSVNAGENWEGTSIQGYAVDSLSVSPNYTNDQTLFAGSSLSGLFKSTDGGATYSTITVVAGDDGVLPVAVSPGYATDQTVFTGTSFSGIYKSTNGGGTWTQLPNTSLLTAFSIALSPNFANDQTLFIGTLQQGLMESTNGGTTLVPITGIPGGGYVTAVALSPCFGLAAGCAAADQTVFAASYLGIYKSTDGGATWVYTAEPARQEEERQFGSGAFFSILYTGTWTITSDRKASTIQLASTTQSGATASLTFLGSGAAWIGKTSATGGTATVSLDGAVVATVNLESATTVEQQTLWTQRSLTCANHTVTITATPGAGQTVNLDALDVWQDTCAWAAPKRPVAKRQ